MTEWALLCAAVLLSAERLFYLWVWHNPDEFEDVCSNSIQVAFCSPVDVLQKCFYLFKILQASVFVAWCYIHSGRLLPTSADPAAMIVGLGLMVLGQVLNYLVFQRLGRVGVFYGNRFGFDVPWVREFPFSAVDHPQYVGALITIWGFFLATRFPHDDWFMVPILETVYYAAGAHFER